MPDTISVDGNTLTVTGNPFTSGPYTLGDHTVTGGNVTVRITIKACDGITVRTTCSHPGFDDGSATFSGVTVGYELFAADILTYSIPSNPFTIPFVGGAGSYTFTETGETFGVITKVSGNFTISAC